MTVQEAIEMLQKIEDKSLPVFTDCPRCDQANAIRSLDIVVVIKAKEEK